MTPYDACYAYVWPRYQTSLKRGCRSLRSPIFECPYDQVVASPWPLQKDYSSQINKSNKQEYSIVTKPKHLWIAAMLSHSLSLAVSVVKSTMGGILTGSSVTLCFFETFLFQLAWPSDLCKSFTTFLKIFTLKPSDLWRMSVTVLKTRRLLSSPALNSNSPPPP